MRSIKYWILAGGVFLLCCYLAASIAFHIRMQRNDGDASAADTRFDENKSLFAAIEHAQQFKLYEGLPHQHNERKLFEQERARTASLDFHGYKFYPDPLELPADEQTKLKTWLGNEGNFNQWGGEKKCGGYHPDYLAEYIVDGKMYQFLICLGCCEVIVYGLDRNLRCDIKHELFANRKQFLKTYRKNRPLPDADSE